jgi:Divalent cation transporter
MPLPLVEASSNNGYGSLEKELGHFQSMSTAVSDSDSETVVEEDEPNWVLLKARTRSLDLESVFSSVRSMETFEEVQENNESEAYLNSTSLQRAMPERFFALSITLLLEIPVLMMVSGGSDALCNLIGRSRYQLLIGFLPLTSAISGNVGLQASTLTTRAISHSHVTIKDYWVWLTTEIIAACYLGLGMGCSLGSIAFVASGLDWAFAVTIALAQLLSIVTAGLTGTIAPLLFSFLFKRDSGKWGGPLETAVQDIVGSFAMVIVSYQILRFLGPGPVDPSDVCGPIAAA